MPNFAPVILANLASLYSIHYKLVNLFLAALIPLIVKRFQFIISLQKLTNVYEIQMWLHCE